jgi:hypothetical protein
LASPKLDPRDPEHPLLTSRPAGTTLWRVSKDPDGLTFSTWSGRLNRFSPAYGADGVTVIGSWYGATTQAGAIFESVFHDIRPSDRNPRVQPNQYVDRFLSPVMTLREIEQVDLTSSGLHAIGLTRVRVIESTSKRYSWTNAIAARLRKAAPDADGFVWVSRAHDTSESFVLFDDPSRGPILGVHPTETSLALGFGPGLQLLRELAVEAKITLVVPSP